MRTVRRLRLRFLLLRPGYPNPNGFHITVLSTLLLFALSKLCQAHQIISQPTFRYSTERDHLVDLGGTAPPSRTLFSRLHTAIYF